MPWPRIPTHRKFPHFNHMSDEEARAAVREIAGSLHREIVGESVAVGILIGGALSIFAGLLMAMFLSGLLMLSPGTLAVIAILTGVAGGYLGAARHYDRMMQLLLSTRLPTTPTAPARARCPKCSYPLVKLREAADGRVTCPECGLVSKTSYF